MSSDGNKQDPSETQAGGDTVAPQAAGTSNAESGVTAENPAARSPAPSAEDRITAAPRFATGPTPQADAPATETAASLTPLGPRSHFGFDVFLGLLTLTLVFLLGSFPVRDSEVLMHLATGKRIVQGEYQFGVDPYSYATQASDQGPATTWVNHSWLYSALLYLAYDALGEAGLVVLHALIGVLLAFVLLGVRARRAPLLLSVFFVGISFLALSTRFVLLPSSVSMLFLAFAICLLYRAGAFGGIEPERIRPRLLWGVPLLCVFWVNLDAWFILGPLLLLLVWAGAGLNAWIGVENGVKGKALGLAFLASLGGCLVNPHFVAALRLPPELGYLLTRLGLPLPQALAPGSYALRELHAPEILYGLLSPLNGAYMDNANFGGNIAGWSLPLLVVLVFLTFLLRGLATAQTGRLQMPMTRAVPLAIFAALALLQVASLAWFCVLAGPMCVLTLWDWLQTREARAGGEPGLERLARPGLCLLLLIGLVMAWPGWLHGRPPDFSAPRRVGWRFDLDPAQTALAQRLAELHADGEVTRVFNTSIRFGSYCAFYAPGVRTYADTRFDLFAAQAENYRECKDKLWQSGVYFLDALQRSLSGKSAPKQPAAAKVWMDSLRRYGVDHIALIGSPTSDRAAPALFRMLWLDGRTWTTRFGAGSAFLIRWNGPKEGRPEEDYFERRTREIFTQVPAERRPSGKPLTLPPSLDTWDLYVRGTEPSWYRWDGYFLLDRFRVQWLTDSVPPIPPLLMSVATEARLLGAVAGATLEGGPLDLGVALPFAYAGDLDASISFIFYPSLRGVFRPEEFGPPAIPHMAIQDARRHLAAQPGIPSSSLLLCKAYGFLDELQEQYWTNYRDENLAPPVEQRWHEVNAKLRGAKSRDASLQLLSEFAAFRRSFDKVLNRKFSSEGQAGICTVRRQLRQMQISVFLKWAADRAGTRPLEAARLHIELADEYFSQYFLDAALEEYQQAQTILSGLGDGADRERLDARIKNLEAMVTERRDEFDRNLPGLLAAKGLPGPRWLLLYNAALNQPYVRHGPGGKSDFDYRGRGLALTMLEQFKNYPASELNHDEVPVFAYFQIDLMLRLGRIAEVAEAMEQEPLKSMSHPVMVRARALVAAILGDYDAFDRQIRDLEERLDEDQTNAQRRFHVLQAAGAITSVQPAAPLGLTWPMGFRYADEAVALAYVTPRVEWRVLRGLVALEAGDGVKARQLFREAFERAGDLRYFAGAYQSELIIARHYLGWLDYYQRGKKK